ncbi:MAG: AMP-binding protein [Rubrivivax sp.]
MTTTATYAELLARNAEACGDQPALLGDSGCITHAELARRARRLAGALAALGVVRDDRIAALAANRHEIIELLGAAAYLGATLVMLNVRWTAAEIAGVVDDAAPRLLFADPELEPLLAAVPAHVDCRSFGAHAGRLAAWDELDRGHEISAPAAGAQAPLLGIPTAAVDGRPRIALLSHAALLHQARLLTDAWSLSATDRYLCMLPLFHAAAMVLTLTAQANGGATVIQARFDPPAAAAAIATHDVSFFASFSPMLAGILDAADAAKSGLPSLRAITGLEPPDAVQRLHERCPQAAFWSLYGQTETSGFATLAPMSARPGSAGKPLPGVELRIEREDGGWALPGEPGEIVLRSACIFNGYWQRPAETAHARRGGWHHTGDRGRLDADGFLWYLGRTADKELIKSGGENVYPAEVEAALAAHPAVAQAVVLGVPDERWGEAVRAVCVLNAGHALTPEALIDFVAERIARFKRPREVLFVPALPCLADGRVDRAAVRASHAG